MTKPKIREDKYTLQHKLVTTIIYLFIFEVIAIICRDFLEISAIYYIIDLPKIDYKKATYSHSLLP